MSSLEEVTGRASGERTECGGGHPERKGCGTLNERSQWKPRRLGVRVGSEAWVRQGSGLQPIGDEGPVVGFQQLRRSLPSQQCSGGPFLPLSGPALSWASKSSLSPCPPPLPPSSRLWGHVRPAGVGSPPQRPEGRLAKADKVGHHASPGLSHAGSHR